MSHSSDKLQSEEEYGKGFHFGYRHVQIILLFLLLAIAYAMRINLSVAIVAMTDNSTTDNPDIPTYDWDNKSVILSSFFWGYICLQLIAGSLGNKYGVKWIVTVAMFINSSACILIPVIAENIGSYGVMGCRMVQGLSQGFFFPSVHNVLGKWAPLEERSFLGTVAFAGPAAGTIAAMAITGFICASWAGWPASFYVFGGLGYAWMVLWVFLGANTPAQHSRISAEEREYIEKSLNVKEDKPPQTPWRAMFTSLPVYAFVVGNFGQNWGYSTLLTEMPSYMNSIMKFDMHANGVLSAAPYLASFIFTFIFGYISDYLINHQHLTRQNARKVFNSIGTCIPAVALVTLGFLPDDAKVLSVLMLILAVGMNAGVFVGFQINAVDLAPKFSGILMGIGNGCSNTFAIIAPLVVQVVVTDETNKALWRTIFIISSFVYVASDVFFLVFASGDVQWWDKAADEDQKAQSAEPKNSITMSEKNV